MNLNALVSLRRKNKITQTQMAEALGCGQSDYQRMESGKYRIKAVDLPVIAAKLNISLNELVNLLFCSQKSA
ncbi:helix-turn-helix domain-containing protein [Risungbinella massiliensis]|uniref:helix-turn-helix domain-containing protein n=1 Tax=Risungbinella massiliensis TaxID=1329796 RepID=UPI0005CBCC3F|nr:helix-turn-helix transcriptional regulator [Risungbinella massiliensis]